MKKIFSLNNGYTLIELLAVMIILVSAGVVVTSIMVSTLRGGNKSTTTNDKAKWAVCNIPDVKNDNFCKRI